MPAALYCRYIKKLLLQSLKRKDTFCMWCQGLWQNVVLGHTGLGWIQTGVVLCTYITKKVAEYSAKIGIFLEQCSPEEWFEKFRPLLISVTVYPVSVLQNLQTREATCKVYMDTCIALLHSVASICLKDFILSLFLVFRFFTQTSFLSQLSQSLLQLMDNCQTTPPPLILSLPTAILQAHPHKRSVTLSAIPNQFAYLKCI